jgi:hypothetical protein
VPEARKEEEVLFAWVWVTGLRIALIKIHNLERANMGLEPVIYTRRRSRQIMARVVNHNLSFVSRRTFVFGHVIFEWKDAEVRMTQIFAKPITSSSLTLCSLAQRENAASGGAELLNNFSADYCSVGIKVLSSWAVWRLCGDGGVREWRRTQLALQHVSADLKACQLLLELGCGGRIYLELQILFCKDVSEIIEKRPNYLPIQFPFLLHFSFEHYIRRPFDSYNWQRSLYRCRIKAEFLTWPSSDTRILTYKKENSKYLILILLMGFLKVFNQTRALAEMW